MGTFTIESVIGGQIVISSLVSGESLRYDGTNWVNVELVEADYAEISANSAGTEQTGIGSTFVKLTQFDTNVKDKISTADSDNDKITLGATGEFIVQCYLSFTGSNNAIYTFAVFNDGVEVANMDAQLKLGTGTDVVNVAFIGFVAGVIAKDLDVRVKTDGTVDVITIQHGALSVEELD